MGPKTLISRNWPAPAKLNLFLHIVGRRQDNYHLLQTVFQFITFNDLLDFSIRKDDTITCTSNCNSIKNNLIIRAAKILQSTTDCGFGANINIKKRIYIGAGLGGGSSDAATTLIALNHLWQLGLPTDQLEKIGLSLGADVPVFIRGQAAWVEGIGEKITPINPVEKYYLVIWPRCHIPTAKIFNSKDLTRNTPIITINNFFTNGGHNDCESIVRKLYPQVAASLDWLNQFGNASITGTGACIYAGFDSEREAKSIYDKLPKSWFGFVARGLNHSPLVDRLAQEKTT